MFFYGLILIYNIFVEICFMSTNPQHYVRIKSRCARHFNTSINDDRVQSVLVIGA